MCNNIRTGFLNNTSYVSVASRWGGVRKASAPGPGPGVGRACKPSWEFFLTGSLVVTCQCRFGSFFVGGGGVGACELFCHGARLLSTLLITARLQADLRHS